MTDDERDPRILTTELRCSAEESDLNLYKAIRYGILTAGEESGMRSLMQLYLYGEDEVLREKAALLMSAGETFKSLADRYPSHEPGCFLCSDRKARFSESVN